MQPQRWKKIKRWIFFLCILTVLALKLFSKDGDWLGPSLKSWSSSGGWKQLPKHWVNLRKNIDISWDILCQKVIGCSAIVLKVEHKLKHLLDESIQCIIVLLIVFSSLHRKIHLLKYFLFWLIYVLNSWSRQSMVWWIGK